MKIKPKITINDLLTKIDEVKEFAEQSDNESAHGIEIDTKRDTWLTVPIIGLKLRFSSIVVVREIDDLINISLNNGVHIKIGITSLDKIQCIFYDKSINVWIPIDCFEQFSKTLSFCFGSK